MKLNLKSNQLKILLGTFKGKLPGLPFHGVTSQYSQRKMLQKLEVIWRQIFLSSPRL